MSEHTKGPWRACKGGECSCGQIWSEVTDSPVATVLSGVWGDTYPAIRLTDGPGMYGTTAEAYLERIDYGVIAPEVANANAAFIVLAVNSHDDLLEALEALMGTVVEPMCYHPDAPGYQEARAKSLAALKKAKL